MFETKLLSTDDQAWSDLLSSRKHDVYHTPQYLEHAGKFEAGDPVCYLGERDETSLMIPFLRRSIVIDNQSTVYSDFTSPYGYPSPLVNADTPDAAERLYKDFCRFMVEQDVVSAFIRMHPLLPSYAFNGLQQFQTCVHGPTVYVDLSIPLGHVRSQMSSNHRRNVRRLLRNGYKLRFNEWADYDTFIALYTVTMDRAEALEFYYFSPDYFYSLKRALGDKLHIVSVTTVDDVVVCAALFFELNGIVQYHLSGTHEDYTKLSPLKLILSEICEWASLRGNNLLHLGGGLGANKDALFKFKAGFSPKQAKFCTQRIIAIPSVYQSLCSRIPDEADAAADNYFPLYRCPLFNSRAA